MASKPKGSSSKQSEKTSDKVDRELAAKAIRKRQSGETPNSREMAALRRFERTREETQRWEFYRSIPQKHWREMSGGRQTKILQEQAQRYGIPFSGRTIDLPEVVKALHEFLAKNAKRFTEDADMAVGDSPALERYRQAKAATAEDELATQRRKLIPAEEVIAEWTKIGQRIRNELQNLASSIVPDALTLGMPMQAAAEFQMKCEAKILGVLRAMSDAGRADGTEETD